MIVFSIMRYIYKMFFERFRLMRVIKHLIINSVVTVSEPVFDSYILIHPADLILADCDRSSVDHPHSENATHHAFIEIRDCVLFFANRFVTRNQLASFNVVGNMERIYSTYNDYFYQEEIQKKLEYNPKTHVLAIKRFGAQIKVSGKYFSILHSSCENWMHWLTETLPLLARMIETGKDIHFGIVHDLVCSNQYEALKIIAQGRPMLTVPPGYSVAVDCLLILKEETLTYPAFWPRNDQALSGSYRFDAKGIILARNKLLSHFGVKPKGHRHIFVKRVSKS